MYTSTKHIDILKPGQFGELISTNGYDPDCYNFLNKMASEDYLENYLLRWKFIATYGFAIPSPKALDVIVSHSQNGLVDVGAGIGYWDYLLNSKGVQVEAFDIAVPGNGENYYFDGIGNTHITKIEIKSKLWFPIQEADSTHIASVMAPEKSLMMIWPDYNTDMAVSTLRAYKGDIFVYVGEGSGGCTGNDDFFELLEKEWDEIDWVKIPTFPGIHDYLMIFKRKNSAMNKLQSLTNTIIQFPNPEILSLKH